MFFNSTFWPLDNKHVALCLQLLLIKVLRYKIILCGISNLWQIGLSPFSLLIISKKFVSSKVKLRLWTQNLLIMSRNFDTGFPFVHFFTFGGIKLKWSPSLKVLQFNPKIFINKRPKYKNKFIFSLPFLDWRICKSQVSQRDENKSEVKRMWFRTFYQVIMSTKMPKIIVI